MHGAVGALAHRVSWCNRHTPENKGHISRFDQTQPKLTAGVRFMYDGLIEAELPLARKISNQYKNRYKNRLTHLDPGI